MTKWLSIIVISIACVIVPFSNSYAVEGKPSYDYLKSVTVYIKGCADAKVQDEAKDSEDNASDILIYPLKDKNEPDRVCWSGTGVIVKIKNNETYILTNSHVAGKYEKNLILLVNNQEQSIQAEVIKYDTYFDIAVIKVPGLLNDKTEIKGIATAIIQDPVYIVGNPLGNKYIYTEGIVAGYVGVSVLLQAPCIYGNSGSGVFNSEGNLIGIVYALQVYPGFMGIPEAQITHSLIVDSISIEVLLKKVGLDAE